MRASPDIETWGDSDPLEKIDGPYSAMRQRLQKMGVLVLPHPILGFCDPQDEIKAKKTIESFGGRISSLMN